MTDTLTLTVDRDRWTKGLQVSLNHTDENGTGFGYRLAGPKYNGSSTNLLQSDLNERDAREIRAILDTVYPAAGTAAAPTPAAITPETARHVLHHYGRPGGYQAGSFTTHLLSAFSAADPSHFARLAAAYPSLGAAVDLAQNHRDGIAQLQAIAAGDR